MSGRRWDTDPEGAGWDPAEALRSLDPAGAAPDYWRGFRREVLRRATHILAERRARAITWGEVVASWAGRVVTTALAAAALAALLLADAGHAGGVDHLALEEILVGEGTVGEPAVGPADAFDGPVLFAAEIF